MNRILKRILRGGIFAVAIAIVALLRYGFVPIRTTDYPKRDSRFASWDDVFRTAGRFTLTPWQTGSGGVESRAKFLDPEAARAKGFVDSKRPLPVWAYYLNHPTWGAALIDTGFDKSFSSSRHGNYNMVSRWYTTTAGTRNSQAPGQSLNDRMAQVPVRPTKVFLTHLHFDHTAGLPALSGNEEIVLGRGEIDFASRALTGHYFERFSQILAIDIEKGQPMPPFDKALDLLGDGSLWAVKTSGHTPGHLSYLVMTVDGPALVTGDACMYYQALERGIGSFSQYSWDRDRNREATRQLREFARTYPQVRFFVGHDDLSAQPLPVRSAANTHAQ